MRRSVARHDHRSEAAATRRLRCVGGEVESLAYARTADLAWGLAARVARVHCLALLVFACGLLAVAGSGAAAAEALAETAESPGDATQIAEADPRVAAVLAGTDYTSDSATWGDGAGNLIVATVVYSWSKAGARDVAAIWPLVLTDSDGLPVPPYDAVEHRLRIENLTSLRVDVLAADGRVLQIYPLAGETRYQLREETWPPFSWVPWFAEQPWVLAPVFIAAAVIITALAWRRSRAWNRRLPSMTRHDRAFIGRLSVILFLVAGLAWQIYEAVYAARSPSVDLGGLDAGDLAALPVLLFPPALFFSALALEFSHGAHRAAWGLVAVLAGAGCVYNLATATLGTAGNLNLSYYILLGVLALLTAPRAFAAGRTGWSRHGMPRYA